jgi:hypothetical protein
MTDQNFQALTTKDGAIYVFPDGANNPGEYIGCTDADDVSEPMGDMELIRCFDVNGRYRVVGETTAPPDPVTTTLTSLTMRTRNYLERIRGKYGLIFLQRDNGRADSFTNWVRAVILQNARNTEKTYAGLVMREEDAASTRAFAISAYPPVIEVVRTEAQSVVNTLTETVNDIHFLPSTDTLLPIKYGVIVLDAPGIGAPAEVFISSDGGRTWTTTTAQPFSNGDGIAACAMIDMGNDVRRILVSRTAAGGTQGETAYSDDNGATWNFTNIGGAAAGHGCVMGGGILAIDRYHIWLVSAEGYIYFSSDAGETWTAKETGVIMATDYHAIAFDDTGTVGYATGVGGVVAKTINGGDDWSAVTVLTGANDGHSIAMKDEDHVWAGDNAGSMFYSDDGGLTWNARTGFGSYDIINKIVFINEYVGFALMNTVAPVGKVLRTIDGGVTWEVIPGDTNAGCYAMFINDPNYGVIAGDVNPTNAYVAVIVEP